MKTSDKYYIIILSDIIASSGYDILFSTSLINDYKSFGIIVIFYSYEYISYGIDLKVINIINIIHNFSEILTIIET